MSDTSKLVERLEQLNGPKNHATGEAHSYTELGEWLEENMDAILAALRQQEAGAVPSRGWIEAAVCPECDGSGFNVRERPRGDLEQIQCQWCDERQRFLAAPAVPDAGELERAAKDTARLDCLDRIYKTCPHTVLGYNDDDGEDAPMGFHMNIDGCEPFDASGETLRDVIDAALQAEADWDAEQSESALSTPGTSAGKDDALRDWQKKAGEQLLGGSIVAGKDEAKERP